MPVLGLRIPIRLESGGRCLKVFGAVQDHNPAGFVRDGFKTLFSRASWAWRRAGRLHSKTLREWWDYASNTGQVCRVSARRQERFQIFSSFQKGSQDGF
jgi:hypothetical protein